MTEDQRPAPQQPPPVQPVFIPVPQQPVWLPPRTNHLFHGLLTLVTCGLWAPVWIGVAISNASKRPRQ